MMRSTNNIHGFSIVDIGFNKLNMIRKAIIFQLLIFIGFAMGCASLDLSTPIKNYDTFYAAIKAKDFNLFSECFNTDIEPYSKNNLRILAEKSFNEITIESHRIIDKKDTGAKEAFIIAEEVSQRKGIRTKSIVRMNYIKMGGMWKIISSETLSFNKEEDKRN